MYQNVPSVAGSWYVKATVAETANYLGATTEPVNFPILKAAVTVTADGKAKIYGEADPALTATVSGAVEGEAISYTLSRVAGETVGEYVIAVAPGVNANYAVTAVNGAFDIGQRVLSVNAEAKTKTEGEADPALTYWTEGLVDGETLTGALTRAEGEAVGEYDILQGTLAASDNYVLFYMGAKLTIVQKAAEGDVETEVKTAANVPKTAVNGLTRTVAEAIATPEEKARVKQGETLLVYLDVTNIDGTVSEDDVAAVTAAALGLDITLGLYTDAQIAQYLDLSVYKKVGSYAPQKVRRLLKNIKTRITIPEDLRREGRVFFIVRVHDGKAEIIDQGTGE